MKCCVVSCSSYTDKSKSNGINISFHSFPSNECLKKKWIDNINRKDWFPTKYTKVCSLHFDANNFISTKKGYRKLQEGACPNLLTRNKDRMRTPEPCALGDFLVFNDTPRKKRLKEEIARLRVKEKIDSLKIRRLQANVLRLKKKVMTMKFLILDLERKNFVNAEESEILTSMDIKVRDLIGRQINKAKKVPLTKKYSPVLRMFALTLHYYSPKAYSYVRQTFDTCLPHPRTISKWYENVNGEAGFTTESFEVLKQKSVKSQEKLLCCLMMDEIAIKKHIEWDGNKCHGYVDLGLNVSQNDNSQEATQALVMLLVCLRAGFGVAPREV